jgi:hypothetical protein
MHARLESELVVVNHNAGAPSASARLVTASQAATYIIGIAVRNGVDAGVAHNPERPIAASDGLNPVHLLIVAGVH